MYLPNIFQFPIPLGAQNTLASISIQFWSGIIKDGSKQAHICHQVVGLALICNTTKYSRSHTYLHTSHQLKKVTNPTVLSRTSGFLIPSNDFFSTMCWPCCHLWWGAFACHKYGFLEQHLDIHNLGNNA